MPDLTVTQRQKFIDDLAKGCTAVEAAGTPSLRRKFYKLKKADPEFAAAWAEALMESVDKLVHVAQSRAVDGWQEPVYYKGEQVGEITRYDHTLLTFLIRQRDPSYRDNSKVELTGGDGKPVEVKVEHTVVDLARVVGLLGAAGVLGTRPAADPAGDEVHPG